MTRTRTPRGALLLSAVLSLGGLYAAPAASALTAAPVLSLNHLLVTSPFVGTSTSLKDNEGLAYVAKDNSLWLASDNDKAIFEIDATTGALKRKISRATFSAALEVGTGAAATDTHDNDLEALAYDNVNDVLYAFSGSTSSVPAIYQLKRDSQGVFQIAGWRGLPSEWTGAGFRPLDGKLYLGNLATFNTYDYATNTFGTPFSVAGVTKVYGVDFAEDATGDMLVVSASNSLQRIDVEGRTVRPGWNLDLTHFGMLDTRAVEVVGRQFYISDGYDFRAAGDQMAHAVFVYDWNDGGGTVSQPVASFTATPTTGNSVQFTDTSTNAPTSWSWTFGDGSTSTSQSPLHAFAAAGTYTVTLTASNSAGSSQKSLTLVVGTTVQAPTASFSASATSGTAPLVVTFTDTSTGGTPTSWAWDFGDGTTSSAQNPPAKTYSAAGSYVVKLTAGNTGGSTSASKTITVTTAGGTPTTFTPDADTYFNTASPTKNYGTSTVLKLHSPTTAEYRPVVRFNVTGVTGTVTKAVLRLWVTDASTTGGTWYKVSNTWTETGVNWNNKPTVVGAPVAGTAGAATLGTWLSVDVTSAINGSGEYSFEATSTSTNTAAFSTRETANAPQLVITP